MEDKGAKICTVRVVPRGAVFISYRHSDGGELATRLAWALRSAGVPVWHDQSDLPPGDTERRLQEAMKSGLSGAVLLVTPEIGQSPVVKEIELPQLLDLESTGTFTLSIASGAPEGEGSDRYRVQKMRWGGTPRAPDRSLIVYNDWITLAGIPEEAHEYVVGPRSVLEWLIDRYRVTTDKASGIVNDPNDWGLEKGDPPLIEG